MIEVAPAPSEATKEVSNADQKMSSHESLKAPSSDAVVPEAPATEPTVDANSDDKREDTAIVAVGDAKTTEAEELKERMAAMTALAATLNPQDSVLENADATPKVGLGFCGAIQPFDSIFKALCFPGDESREPVDSEDPKVTIPPATREGSTTEGFGLEILQGISFEEAKTRALDNFETAAKAAKEAAHNFLIETEEERKVREAKEAKKAAAAEEAKKKAQEEAEKKAAKEEAKAKAKARAKEEARLKIIAKAEAKRKAEAAAKAKAEAKARAIAEAKAANKAKAKAESAAKAAEKAKAKAESEHRAAVKARAKAAAKAEALVKAEAAIIALEEDRKKAKIEEDENMKRINRILNDEATDEDYELETKKLTAGKEENKADDKADDEKAEAGSEGEKLIQDALSKEDGYADTVALAASMSQGDDLSFSDVSKLNEKAKSIVAKTFDEGDTRKGKKGKPQKSADGEELKKMNQKATSLISGVWKRGSKKSKKQEQALE